MDLSPRHRNVVIDQRQCACLHDLFVIPSAARIKWTGRVCLEAFVLQRSREEVFKRSHLYVPSIKTNNKSLSISAFPPRTLLCLKRKIFIYCIMNKRNQRSCSPDHHRRGQQQPSLFQTLLKSFLYLKKKDSMCQLSTIFYTKEAGISNISFTPNPGEARVLHFRQRHSPSVF